MGLTRRELIRVIRGAVLQAFPVLGRRLQPVRGRIVAVYSAEGRGGTNRVYSVDVQPLDASGQPVGAVLPHLSVPTVWVGNGCGILALPPVGALARVNWYDTGEPFLDAVLPDGFDLPGQTAGRLTIVHPGGRIEVDSTGVMIEAADTGSIILKGDMVMVMGDLVVSGTIN